MDGITRKVKITTHCVFDEAGMTIPEADRSSANRALQQHGYSTKLSEFTEQESSYRPPITADLIQQNIAWIKLLSNQAQMPSRATEDSTGFDVCSATTLTIPPTERRSIPLDISLLPPNGMYAQIMPQSGLASKHLIDTKVGVIDRDYTGNIHVILHNAGTEDFNITTGDRIAQIIFYHISHPILTPTHSLDVTQREDNGFGSTGITSVVRTLQVNQMSDESVLMTQPTLLSDESIPPLPYDIYLSEDPFDDQLNVDITLKR
jgi:dUTP pyrophosphatase